MSTVNYNSLFFPKIIEQTHLKLILRLPSLFPDLIELVMSLVMYLVTIPVMFYVMIYVMIFLEILLGFSHINWLIITIASFGWLFFTPWLIYKLKELYTRIVCHYFVFDKYSQKLEHTVKIFNCPLNSKSYRISDITEVRLEESIGYDNEGNPLEYYTLRLLLNSYKRSGSQKDILLRKKRKSSIGNLSEIQKVISDFLSVKSTNKGMEN
jgi:hypothetical protein